MKSKLCSFTCMAALVTLVFPPVCFADKSASRMVKQQEGYTLSLELEFTKKQQNPLEHAISVLFDVGPNGYATGFLVGNGLVMTAYHVISGNLSTTKKVMLGFKATDELSVKASERVSIAGMKSNEAALVKVSKELADLSARYVRLEAQIRTASPRYVELLEPQPPSLGEIREQVVDNQTLLLEYYLGADRSYVWAVTSTSINLYELPKRAVIIQSSRKTVYFLLHSRRSQDDQH